MPPEWQDEMAAILERHLRLSVRTPETRREIAESIRAYAAEGGIRPEHVAHLRLVWRAVTGDAPDGAGVPGRAPDDGAGAAAGKAAVDDIPQRHRASGGDNGHSRRTAGGTSRGESYSVRPRAGPCPAPSAMGTHTVRGPTPRHPPFEGGVATKP